MTLIQKPIRTSSLNSYMCLLQLCLLQPLQENILEWKAVTPQHSLSLPGLLSSIHPCLSFNFVCQELNWKGNISNIVMSTLPSIGRDFHHQFTCFSFMCGAISKEARRRQLIEIPPWPTSVGLNPTQWPTSVGLNPTRRLCCTSKQFLQE